MNSLERSLQIGLIGSLCVILFVFWWTATLSSRMLTERFVFGRLAVKASNIESILEFSDVPEPSVQLGRYKLDPAYGLPASGHYFVVRTDDRLLMSRSAWEQFFEVPVLVPGEKRLLRTTGVSGEALLLWYGGFSEGGQEFTIAVAENVSPIKAKLQVFQWFSAIVAFVLLVGMLSVQRLIVKHSVDKLETIQRDMQRLEHGQAVSLSEDVPDEVLPLVREFNRLLRRYDQRLRQSRNAAGNLAHSLKGPLNLLLRCTESTHIGRAEQTLIGQNAESIRQLIESELKRARLAGRGTVGQRFVVDEELPALIGLLEQVYSDKTVDVRYNIGPGVELVHDRQDMLELIGNLLDNAVKWSRSVVIINLRSADGILMDVEDDGPGCSPEELGRLTERGVRIDESVAGHGLGLSIVKDIVDSYEGRLELATSARLGGLRASVYLPSRSLSRD
ncbi:ATP-binding protein [Granulosicoccus antarcticus]|uniref:histidine kinase n=1 Tax=Granulosicoccus antarcticus IMCC3135 TaxID=1192854 RepID=A0A2Z2NLT4_9GAMM|nr:ATP-binding protein [Granulosicoccus antarcticus]ASJ72296.1 Virulence sensor histidine kinase PhoQ [Granulosicoccus antarcticus IMCC3135]